MNRIAAIFVLIGAVYPAAAEVKEVKNDYPTAARAEYVFGCMGANGQTPEMLRKCSCSIDVIASLIAYERYVQIETILRMAQVPGERTAAYRGSMWANSMIDELRSAEAEATLKCF